MSRNELEIAIKEDDVSRVWALVNVQKVRVDQANLNLASNIHSSDILLLLLSKVDFQINFQECYSFALKGTSISNLYLLTERAEKQGISIVISNEDFLSVIVKGDRYFANTLYMQAEKNGSPIDIHYKNELPFKTAVTGSDICVVTYLLHKSIDINSPIDIHIDNEEPFRIAVFQKKSDVIKYLVNQAIKMDSPINLDVNDSYALRNAPDERMEIFYLTHGAKIPDDLHTPLVDEWRKGFHPLQTYSKNAKKATSLRDIIDTMKFGIELETCVHILDGEDTIESYINCLQSKSENVEWTSDSEKFTNYDTWILMEDGSIDCNKEGPCVVKNDLYCEGLKFFPVEIVTPILIGILGIKVFTYVYYGFLLSDNFVYRVNSSQGLHINLSHPKVNDKQFVEMWKCVEPALFESLSPTRKNTSWDYARPVYTQDKINTDSKISINSHPRRSH